MIDVQKALAELATKPVHVIQKEAAFTWASRAIAAIHYADNAKGSAEFLRWMADAHEYYHEALEHAALDEEKGFVDNIKKQINFPKKDFT